MKHPNKRYKCSFGPRYRGRVDRLSAAGPSMDTLESTDKRTIRSLQDGEP